MKAPKAEEVCEKLGIKPTPEAVHEIRRAQADAIMEATEEVSRQYGENTIGTKILKSKARDIVEGR